MSKSIPPKPIPNSFLNAAQIADRWNMSERQVRRMFAKGELPTHKFGKLIRASLKDILLHEAGSFRLIAG